MPVIVCHSLVAAKFKVGLFLREADGATLPEKQHAAQSYRKIVKEHYAFPWQRDLFLFWLPASYEPSPARLVFSVLWSLPSVRYEAVQNRWRQQ